MSLISPGVVVTVTDESFFIPSAAATVPLIFLATASEKQQPGTAGAASGTYESNIIRTITSIKQSIAMYGLPRFIENAAGQPQHGDARNEYGLFALNQFLGVGNRAYAIRADVNLDDSIDHVRTIFDGRMLDAADELQALTTQFINNYNVANGYVPSSATSGYQNVRFTNVALTAATTTGLVGGTIYTTTITIDGVAIPLTVDGTSAPTFADLFNEINAGLGVAGNVTFSVVAGQIQIQSSSSGSPSTVSIVDGVTNPLFASIADFHSILVAVPGASLYKRTVTPLELTALATQATQDLWEQTVFASLQADFFGTYDPGLMPCTHPVYADGFDFTATGCFAGFGGALDKWVDDASGAIVVGEFSPTEAANMLTSVADDFKYTLVFANETSLGNTDADRRSRIVTALRAAINGNEDIRSEQFEYNLILCPGYHECVNNMVALSIDIKEEAFVIADTPMDQDPADTANWGSTTARSTSRNVAYYYPHGLASNIDGKVVFVAASGIALRTYAYSDNVSYLWFAPAGTRRGMVSGILDVGYLTGNISENAKFIPVALNIGQRDDLYKYFTNINPITYFPGRGIIVWGQKTSAPDASALDRVNVVRMIMHIRRQLRKHTMSFVFEPNDQLTRDNLKAVVDGFLGDIMSKRGIMDFATVCSEANNTPQIIDNNQMVCDVAIKPTKAAEFIIIPIRVVSTGAAI